MYLKALKFPFEFHLFVIYKGIKDTKEVCFSSSHQQKRGVKRHPPNDIFWKNDIQGTICMKLEGK